MEILCALETGMFALEGIDKIEVEGENIILYSKDKVKSTFSQKENFSLTILGGE